MSSSRSSKKLRQQKTVKLEKAISIDNPTGEYGAMISNLWGGGVAPLRLQ